MLDELVKQMTSHSPDDRPPTARHVRHKLYRIYRAVHPEFEIPDEVFTQATNTTKEEQFISQKILKSGMAAAVSALKQEQDNERKRQTANRSKGSFERLKAFGKDSLPGTVSSARNPKASQQSSKERVPAVNQRSTRSNNPKQSGERAQMKSVRDLKPEKGFWEKFLDLFRG
jgi:hypothetical protein